MSKSSLCFMEHKKLRSKSFLSSKSIQEHSVTQIHPLYFRCFCNNRSPFVHPSNWADATDGWYLRREIQPSKTTQDYHRELACFGCETRCSMEPVSFREKFYRAHTHTHTQRDALRLDLSLAFLSYHLHSQSPAELDIGTSGQTMHDSCKFQ